VPAASRGAGARCMVPFFGDSFLCPKHRARLPFVALGGTKTARRLTSAKFAYWPQLAQARLPGLGARVRYAPGRMVPAVRTGEESNSRVVNALALEGWMESDQLARFTMKRAGSTGRSNHKVQIKSALHTTCKRAGELQPPCNENSLGSRRDGLAPGASHHNVWMSGMPGAGQIHFGGP